MSFLPKQTLFIVGNEACERFGFYGMRSILTLYLTTVLLMDKDASVFVMHVFLGLVYLTPLLGAWIADKVLGRYKTILYISLLYCLGFFILATSDIFSSIEMKKWVLISGLMVIGFGSGGIKPCVSSFMGDQIPDKSPKIMTRAYSAFYWSINLGSFFAFLIIPTMRDEYGWSAAFMIPGIFMAIATFVLWLGRKQYHHIPPKREKTGAGFWSILSHVIFKGGFGIAQNRFGDEKVDNVRRVLKILSIFIFVIPFWALFEQTTSSWVLQGKEMTPIDINLPWGTHFKIGTEQIQAANPAFIMVMIPLINILVYPYVKKLASPLVRMGCGIFLAACSFCFIAWFQHRIEQGEILSLAWQIIPYFIITIGEILLSTTGLEFAYTQAPKALKSVITSCWNLTIFAANAVVASIALVYSYLSGGGETVSTSGFTFYTIFAFLAVVFFIFSAKKYGRQS